MTRQDLHTLVVAEARRLGLDPLLALALAEQESGFNPTAKSPTGVVGLFQVTNKTGAAYGQTPETRTDPQVSAHAGLTYFRDLLQQAGGNVELALTHYNGGSDPHFAQHVLGHRPAHELAQRLYGDQRPDVPAAPSLAEVLYGSQPQRPPTGTDAPARGDAPRQPPTLAEVLYGPSPAEPGGAAGPGSPAFHDAVHALGFPTNAPLSPWQTAQVQTKITATQTGQLQPLGVPPGSPGGLPGTVAIDQASRPAGPAPSLAEVLYGSQPEEGDHP
jgi:hypothetical protein